MADLMDWHSTTPPPLFNPYHVPQYVPGGWPIASSTTTAGVFARRPETPFVIRASKRICRGLQFTAGIIVVPVYRIVQRVNAARRGRNQRNGSPSNIIGQEQLPEQRLEASRPQDQVTHTSRRLDFVTISRNTFTVPYIDNSDTDESMTASTATPSKHEVSRRTDLRAHHASNQSHVEPEQPLSHNPDTLPLPSSNIRTVSSRNTPAYPLLPPASPEMADYSKMSKSQRLRFIRLFRPRLNNITAMNTKPTVSRKRLSAHIGQPESIVTAEKTSPKDTRNHTSPHTRRAHADPLLEIRKDDPKQTNILLRPSKLETNPQTQVQSPSNQLWTEFNEYIAEEETKSRPGKDHDAVEAEHKTDLDSKATADIDDSASDDFDLRWSVSKSKQPRRPIGVVPDDQRPLSIVSANQDTEATQREIEEPEVCVFEAPTIHVRPHPPVLEKMHPPEWNTSIMVDAKAISHKVIFPPPFNMSATTPTKNCGSSICESLDFELRSTPGAFPEEYQEQETNQLLLPAMSQVDAGQAQSQENLKGRTPLSSDSLDAFPTPNPKSQESASSQTDKSPSSAVAAREIEDMRSTPIKTTENVESHVQELCQRMVTPDIPIHRLRLGPAESVPDNDTPKATFHSGEKTKRLTRAQKRMQEAQQETLLYEIVPLSTEWDKKVRKAVQTGIEKYSASDLGRVVPEYASHGQHNWLNDETINGYLTLVAKHGKKNDRPGQVPSHHSFNTFFYSNISNKGPQSVTSWAKRAKVGGKALLDVDKIFIPVNSGVHWTLAVVSGKNKSITHYNSMRSATLGATVCNRIKTWIEFELGKDFHEEDWTMQLAGESPQQTNGDDCGVFTITSARQIMLGFEPIKSYRANQISVQRKRIVAELINGGLLKKDES